LAETIPTPGAMISGFGSRVSVGPRELKFATVLVRVIAPTVIAEGAMPGMPTV
jgi:hypothetical protein